jgi:hypothetical protein
LRYACQVQTVKQNSTGPGTRENIWYCIHAGFLFLLGVACVSAFYFNGLLNSVIVWFLSATTVRPPI